MLSFSTDFSNNISRISSQIANLNRHLDGVDQDYLYHIGLEKRGDNLKKMFGDVKVGKRSTMLTLEWK